MGHVLLAAAAAGLIACVIGNGVGQRKGCEAQGKQIRGLECVEKKGEK